MSFDAILTKYVELIFTAFTIVNTIIVVVI